ncbi:MAG TPA: hypothetical protein VD993_11325 [Chitinophagaceae bacterium]|nr:hypothetical protein [Chitinophagaceae bacterium]
MKRQESFKTHYTKKEVKEIFTRYDLRSRNDLKYDNTDPFDYYELPDGRILLVLGFGNDTGIMYRSEQELMHIMAKPDIRSSGEHVLADLIPSDTQFIEKKEAYITALSIKLAISIEKLDKSLASLKLIDSAYRRNRPEPSEFFAKDFLYIITYLGEVYCKELEGRWVFEKQVTNKSYEPYIELEDGQKLDTFIRLFKECYENYANFSIYALAVATVSRYKLQ